MVENHWFSVTVSNARCTTKTRASSQASTQDNPCLRQKVHKCNDCLFGHLWKNVLCVHVGKCEDSFFSFFGHSPKMVDEMYFHWKWMHFRKIYKEHLSLFWSWRHFWDTSHTYKNLTGDTVGDQKLSTVYVNQMNLNGKLRKKLRGATKNLGDTPSSIATN